MIPTVGVNDFCRNHHRLGTEFTEFLALTSEGEQDWGVLVELVRANFERRRPGYRPGVFLVPVPAGEGIFTTPVVDITPDDLFVTVYRPRREGETPRKASKVARVNALGEERTPSPAKYVDVVLYSREVLEENDEDRTGCDWDIITILGKLTEEDQPMTPGTLMSNHFGLDGGSDTKMDAVAFEAALRKSVTFWSGRGLLEGP